MYRSTRSTKQSSKLKILPEEPEDSAAGAAGGTSGGNTPNTASSPVIGSSVDGGPSTTASGGYRRNPAYSEPPGPTTTAAAVAATNSVDDDDSSSDDAGEGEDEEAVEVYKQLDQIPEGSMRRDARRLTKRSRAKLPRVTAYSTATSYRMRELTKWLNARRSSHQTNVLTFDECVYTTYTYKHVDEARGLLPSNANGNSNGKHRSHRDSTPATKTADLLGIPELNPNSQSNPQEDGNGQNSTTTDSAAKRKRSRFSVDDIVPELFIMDYGTIVIWGMTLPEEKRFLRELRRFEVERLASEDVESEDLHWYLADYSRIYNDVITLRRGSSYMTKLSLSHALAQSTKISFFEGIIDNTIESTKDIPQSIAESGKIGMPPAEIMKQIGHLFILRMNIHLVGSIVDSPEIFWRQPDLEPLYSAARSYLEIPQRIDLLNTRVEVLQDMLQLLKDQVTSSHSEYLEIVVILLIMLEIVLGVATMLVDLYFG